MPTSPAIVTNVIGTQSGTAQLSLFDQNFNALLTFLNTVRNYSNYLVDTGTINHYVVTFPGGLNFTLVAGQYLQMQASHTNSGACDIAVNGGTAKAIKTQAGADPGAGAIVANGIYNLMYDSASHWQLI